MPVALAVPSVAPWGAESWSDIVLVVAVLEATTGSTDTWTDVAVDPAGIVAVPEAAV